MIYEIECSLCGHLHDAVCKMVDIDPYIQYSECPNCRETGHLRQIFKSPPMGFLKSPFPKGFFEHVSEHGAHARDKHELKDIAEANGQVSHYVENAM